MAKKYEHKKIESKWQKRWEEEGVNRPQKMNDTKNSFYNLWMFPYPSAEGLHAGHAFASTGSDVIGRFQRMNGKDVFQPIGYDSFGIHGENYAIKQGKHPMELINKTTKNYERQLKNLGHGYDWTRTVTTSEPDYYKWTQWLFIQLFKAGLAYRKEAEVNWCPSCKTVLADEQVMSPAQAEKEPKNAKGEKVKDAGDLQVCERCGTVVERKKLAQWFFRITDYADKLLEGLEKIDWPEKIKLAQRNWIGKSEGARINFRIFNYQFSIDVFTTRPDTLYGATFFVISPEHQIVDKIIAGEFGSDKDKITELKKYIKRVKSETKSDRISSKEKTGVITGLYVINPANNEKIPVYISDYVLMDYGTGAIMGVPAHDQRDHDFAKKHDLPIIQVVSGPKVNESSHNEAGKLTNSDDWNGIKVPQNIDKVINDVEKKGWGKSELNYHLRDWLISRQRYWGPPIPMIYCKKCAEKGRGWIKKNQESRIKNQQYSDWESVGWWPVPEKDLPVELPFLKDFKPKGGGRGPLADSQEFLSVNCPECNSEAERESDVSDTFLDSAWYFLRYPSTCFARSGQVPFDDKITRTWLPVDLYFGGAEHAVLHLMYARFITMVLSDLGLIDFDEPFPKFFAHGLMIKDGAKMSKSRGNVVNPDKYIEKFGADTLRLYTMFMGPMDGYPDFRDTGIEGMSRFIGRVWELYQVDENSKNEKRNSKQIPNSKLQNSTENLTTNYQLLTTKMHQTIKKCTEDIQEYKYNTAIAAIMELVNLMRIISQKSEVKNQNDKSKLKKDKAKDWNESLVMLCLLLAPFAPHFAEEVWCEVLGNDFSVHKAKWPNFDPKLIKEEMVTIAVQVNGKLRSTLEVDRSISDDKAKIITLTEKDSNVTKWIKGKDIKKEIFIPGKLVNFVSVEQ